jgi:hypothetical protein
MFNVSTVNVLHRRTQGVRLMKLELDEVVADVALLPAEEPGEGSERPPLPGRPSLPDGQAGLGAGPGDVTVSGLGLDRVDGRAEGEGPGAPDAGEKPGAPGPDDGGLEDEGGNGDD